VTVRELGRLLRTGKASSVELVQETLGAIKERDHFRTFITITGDSAIQAAIDADKERAAGIDRGPFHGIPVAYKDLFYTKGVRTTGGSLIYGDFVPEYDSTVVEKMRVAGAISLGKLNQHELAYGTSSKNPHYGFVSNPHNREHVAGGSSGGSATAIAAGFLPVTFGSDTGGSIRIPASYCGVTGFKPTYGRASKYGVLPLAYSLDHVGPLGTCVEDCAFAMAEIAGYDERDATTSTLAVPDFYKAPWRRLDGIRFGIPTNFYFEHVDSEVSKAVHAAAKEIERLGATVVEIDLPDMNEINIAARFIQWAESSAIYAGYTDSTKFGTDLWALIEQGRAVTGVEYVTAQRLRTVFRREFDNIWRNIDALITPATPITAPRIDQDKVDIDGYIEDARIASTRLTRGINLIGEPALAMPCGRSHEGMPIGLQLVAPPFADAWLLRVGQTIERQISAI
jgi:aspartyl-tRNA(Asn)/glutamyl-tRNA(Gln) amidotransferase subunit A